MSLVSSRLSLTHRCTLERPAAAAADTWGNDPPASWQSHLSDLPCRIWVTAGQEAMDATTTAVVEDMRLLVATGTDVTERDRIASVTFRGATIVAGPVGIRAVLYRADHIELVLMRIA